MNKHEALEVLAREASRYRGSSHESLQRLLATPETKEGRGTSETLYQVEVSAAWDDRPAGLLRLFFSIDDGGLRAFCPITRSALVQPGGIFDGQIA